MKRNYVFDFDSTLTSVEALDVLAEITLKNNPNKDKVIQEIVEITNLGIDGEISFTESLERRIKLLKAKESDLAKLIQELKKKVSTSIEKNKEFFENYADDIYVISAGFKEFIVPIVAKYNIAEERVFANTFEFNNKGFIVGFDRDNPLSAHNGKIKCLKDLKLKGEIQVIGDGYSDYVTREAGIADKFFAFTENVTRLKTAENADYIAPNLDEFLFVNDLPRRFSYPKNRIKILLQEKIDLNVFKQFLEDGFTVEIFSGAFSNSELKEKLKTAHILCITSDVVLDKELISLTEKLLVVGVFDEEQNNIDLDACKELGILVFGNKKYAIETEKATKKITKDILKFINTGNSINALNFPNIKLKPLENSHRFLHIHQNIPGVMAAINKVLFNSEMNIVSQYLSTDETVGYVMTDVDEHYNPTLIDKLKSIDGTIKFRVLY